MTKSIDKIYKKSTNDIMGSYFDEYRKEVENLDSSYVELLSYSRTGKLINENVTTLNQFFISDFLKVLGEKEYKKVNNFTGDFFKHVRQPQLWTSRKNDMILKIQYSYGGTSAEVQPSEPDNAKTAKGMRSKAFKTYKTESQKLLLLKQIYEADGETDPEAESEKAQNTLNQVISKIEDDFNKFQTDSEDEGKVLKVIQAGLNDLDMGDFNKTFGKTITDPTKKELILNNAKTLITDLNSNGHKYKEILFDILNNKIYNNLEPYKIVESNKPDAEEVVNIQEAYAILRSKKIFNYSYKMLKTNATAIDKSITRAEKQAMPSEAKLNPLSKSSADAVQAKKLVLAFLTIIITLYISQTFVSMNKENEEEDINEDLFSIYGKEMSSYNEVLGSIIKPVSLLATPAKMFFKVAKRGVLKKITVASMEALTATPQSFVQNAKRYFYLLGGNTSQISKVLSQYHINLDHISELSNMDADKAQLTQIVSQSKQMLSPNNVYKISIQLFREYGIKKSFGGQLGDVTRNVIDKVTKQDVSGMNDTEPVDKTTVED